MSTDLFTVAEQLESVRTHIDLMMQGVDIVAYRKFRELTPSACITTTNTVFVDDDRLRETLQPSKEDAYFCVEFVVEAALQVLSNRPQGWSYDHPKDRIRSAVAKHECEVIVHPSEDPPEIIRAISVGETLSVIGIPCESHPNYAEVLQDDDICYVRLDCICVSIPAADDD
jgi:hypothetical protein